MHSLIIPSYNPGRALIETWFRLRHFISQQFMPWEVLFVCDGSTDGSPEQLMTWCREQSITWCRVIRYERNQGKGAAVRLGFEAARGRIKLFTDADLAYSFEDILRVASMVSESKPVAIASREHAESLALIPMPLVHYVGRRRRQSLVFRFLVHQLLGLTHVDTQAGLKAFSSHALNQILPHLGCSGFGFDCELLLACERLGWKVTEVPVTVRYQSVNSTTSWRCSLRMIRELLEIRRRWHHCFPPGIPVPVTVQEFSNQQKLQLLSQAA